MLVDDLVNVINNNEMPLPNISLENRSAHAGFPHTGNSCPVQVAKVRYCYKKPSLPADTISIIDTYAPSCAHRTAA